MLDVISREESLIEESLSFRYEITICISKATVIFVSKAGNDVDAFFGELGNDVS